MTGMAMKATCRNCGFRIRLEPESSRWVHDSSGWETCPTNTVAEPVRP